MPTRDIITALIILLIIAFIYTTETILICIYIYNKLKRSYRPNILLSKRVVMLHLIALLGIVCFCYGYFVEPYRIEINMIPVRTDKLSSTSFRIVQITDLHCDKKIVNEKAIIDIINNLEPDAIVFTGDAINRPSALPLFKETMKNLKASLGKFAVYGNWEINHWPGLDYYSQTGFELLNAQTVRLEKNNESITISGLRCDNGRFADGTIGNLSSETYNVFLFHYPDFAKYIYDYNVDLYLCGHTHGGQIALPYYGALITMTNQGKKYEAGKYSVGHTILYVNKGLGMDAFPGPKIRFFARPEIAVFDIGPEN